MFVCAFDPDVDEALEGRMFWEHLRDRDMIGFPESCHHFRALTLEEREQLRAAADAALDVIAADGASCADGSYAPTETAGESVDFTSHDCFVRPCQSYEMPRMHAGARGLSVIRDRLGKSWMVPQQFTGIACCQATSPSRDRFSAPAEIPPTSRGSSLGNLLRTMAEYARTPEVAARLSEQLAPILNTGSPIAAAMIAPALEIAARASDARRERARVRRARRRSRRRISAVARVTPPPLG